MTIEEIFTKYSYIIYKYAGSISHKDMDDIVGDWLLDTLKRGDDYIQTLLYKDSGKVNFGRLKKSIFQSWYTHNRKAIKYNVKYEPILENVFSVQPLVFPVFDDVRLTKRENDVVRYILTSGCGGRLPVNKKSAVYSNISMLLFGKTGGSVIQHRKKCKKCGKVKPLSDFHVNKLSSDGRSSYCKECMSKYYKRKRN
jgi:hypothetical protein